MNQEKEGKVIPHNMGIRDWKPSHVRVDVQPKGNGYIGVATLYYPQIAWIMSPAETLKEFQADVCATLHDEIGDNIIFNIEFYDEDGNRIQDGTDRLIDDVVKKGKMHSDSNRCHFCGRELQAGEYIYCSDCSDEVNVDVYNDDEPPSDEGSLTEGELADGRKEAHCG